MKIWTLTIETDHFGVLTAIHFTKAAADAQAVEVVTAWYERHIAADGEPRDHTDWQESYSILCDAMGFNESISLVEHDISEHPAVKEATATLWACLARLELNDIDGEEQPFMEDCATAIALLGA